MLDLRAIRDDPAALDRAMARRGLAPQSARILDLDSRRRAAQTLLQELQQRRNEASKEIGSARKAGRDVESLLAEMAANGGAGGGAALIVQPRLRRAMAALLRLRAPGCVVLSIAELPETQPVEVIAVVGGEPPPQRGLPAPEPSHEPSSARQPAESMAA